MKKLIDTFDKKTKIIATFGPAITGNLWSLKDLTLTKNKKAVAQAYSNVEQLINAGMSCARLNFSHGTYEEQLLRIKIIRDVAKKLNKHIPIILDTKGPEIRLGKFNSKVPVPIGTQLEIYTTKDIIGNSKKFSVNATTPNYNMINDIKVGSIILVDDGKLRLLVTKIDKSKNIITAVAQNSHYISERKRINLPDADYTMPFLSEKDKQDIQFACDNKLDIIALSFVNNAANVEAIRDILAKNNSQNIQIISKIETKNAIKNLDKIIDVSDGIMVARGDLSLEIPYWEVPYWEEQIISKTRSQGKLSIVATQMLDSLEHNIQPTRAEVTDVYYAVKLGADATMLSGETANGEFPVNALQTMSNIDVYAESRFNYWNAYIKFLRNKSFPQYAKSIGVKIAKKILPNDKHLGITSKYQSLVIFSDDKLLIKAISNLRPIVPTILVTSEKELLNYYGIYYGIQTYLVNDLNKAKEKYEQVVKDIFKTSKLKKLTLVYMNKKLYEI